MKDWRLPFERDFTTILDTLLLCQLHPFSKKKKSSYYFWTETQSNHNHIFVLIFRHSNVISIWHIGLQIFCTCTVAAHQHWKVQLSYQEYTNKLILCNCASVQTLCLHHLLIHYTLLLTVILVLPSINLGVNFIKLKCLYVVRHQKTHWLKSQCNDHKYKIFCFCNCILTHVLVTC